jgi:hypothetical protein
MVGRSEVIMPGVEKELARCIEAYGSADTMARLQALSDTKQLALGRFLNPAVTRALGPKPNPARAQVAWKLASEVNAVDKTPKVATVTESARPKL